MDKLEKTKTMITELSSLMNEERFKELGANKDNLFNQYASLLNTDLEYIKIILERIKSYDHNKNTSALGLDIKSLVIFCRIYTESLLNIIQLFIREKENLPWNKLGSFVKKMKEDNTLGENILLKSFWDSQKEILEKTSRELKYRNTIAHDKNKGTEWTMSHPGRDNLQHSSITNAYRKNGTEKPSDKTSRTPAENIETIHAFTEGIVDYIKKTFLLN